MGSVSGPEDQGAGNDDSPESIRAGHPVVSIAQWLMMQEFQAFDEDGVCIFCGFQRPDIIFLQHRREEVVNFIIPIKLNAGDVLRIPSPATDSNGEMIPGDFVGEVTKDNVVRIIGRG